ncbi:hypothetical protein [Ferrithrix thermotolerans]|uniref:hypothetical protein n=1 Tax=Ferrithrix thermotolerans TaxID=209649 RepID=UPI0015BB8F72|nr:hypothetical protein [Ferrithrix thermotolerans]
MKTEQDRIGGQLMRIHEGLAEADANYEQARRTPADTLNLTRDCHAAYLEANDSTRRLFNQAFFAKIYIDEDDETREQTVQVDYNEPFDSLLSRLIPARVHHTLDIRKTAHPDTSEGGPETSFEGTAKVQGSHTDTLVEVIALLAKQEVAPTLEAALGGQREDQCAPRTRRSVQRQRRLAPSEITRLAQDYAAGSTVNQLAMRYGVHRTTVLNHLEQQGIDRRRTHRVLSKDDVARAAALYSSGRSLKATGSHFGVDAETIRREFKKAGVAIRPRRGWK